MGSLKSIFRGGIVAVPVVLLGTLGAKAIIAPSSFNATTAVIQPSANNVAPASALVASKIETADSTDSSTTVSMALPVILPIRTPVRP